MDSWAREGERLKIGAYKATVGYVGPVEGQQGTWVGLDWDVEERGKHNGEYQGKVYFHCRRQRKSGSLVRYEKLKQHRICQGIELEEAITARYKQGSDGMYLIDNTTKKQHLDIRGGFEVQIVGAEEAERVVAADGALKQASSSGMCVSRLGMTDTVVRMLENVELLDLSDNLLSSWDDIISTANTLKYLKVLDISQNTLDVPTSKQEITVEHVAVLAMNSCGLLCVGDLIGIDAVFPKLQELYVYKNSIQLQMDDKILRFHHLTTLDLGSNGVNSWALLSQSVGRLPALKTLLLQENFIEHISMQPETFQNLEHLNLACNQISTWRAVQGLALLHNLRELRLSDNPLFQGEGKAESNRIQVIGRFGTIECFNGSVISESERRDGELAFVRHVNQYISETEDKTAELNARVLQLQQKYQILSSDMESETMKNQSLSSRMVRIRILAEGKTVSKRVPESLTINKLKILVQKLLKIEVGDQVLQMQYAHPNHPDGILGEDITHQGDKDLAFFASHEEDIAVVVTHSDFHSQQSRTVLDVNSSTWDEHERDMQRLKAEEERLFRSQV